MDVMSEYESKKSLNTLLILLGEHPARSLNTLFSVSLCVLRKASLRTPPGNKWAVDTDMTIKSAPSRSIRLFHGASGNNDRRSWSRPLARWASTASDVAHACCGAWGAHAECGECTLGASSRQRQERKISLGMLGLLGKFGFVLDPSAAISKCTANGRLLSLSYISYLRIVRSALPVIPEGVRRVLNTPHFFFDAVLSAVPSAVQSAVQSAVLSAEPRSVDRSGGGTQRSAGMHGPPRAMLLTR